MVYLSRVEGCGLVPRGLWTYPILPQLPHRILWLVIRKQAVRILGRAVANWSRWLRSRPGWPISIIDVGKTILFFIVSKAKWRQWIPYVFSDENHTWIVMQIGLLLNEISLRLWKWIFKLRPSNYASWITSFYGVCQPVPRRGVYRIIYGPFTESRYDLLFRTLVYCKSTLRSTSVAVNIIVIA